MHYDAIYTWARALASNQKIIFQVMNLRAWNWQPFNLHVDCEYI